MTKNEVTLSLKSAFLSFENVLESFDDTVYFSSKGEKWGPAENTQHLVLSAAPVVLAFSLPKFLLRLFFGKPKRISNSYDELRNRYLLKLVGGAKATKTYVPISNKPNVTKEEELKKFMRIHHKLLAKIEKWRDDDLDKYLLPHPLLGKITLREMLYFTIFHIEHHEQTIQNRYSLK